MKLFFSSLLTVIALPAFATDFYLGLVGITYVETARLAAFCPDEAGPCEAALHFHDVGGGIVKEAALLLDPGAVGFLDVRATDTGLTPGRRLEIVPCVRVVRGGVFASLRIFDNLTVRSRIFANWSGGASPHAGEIHFGAAGITPFDTSRINAFCPGDPSRTSPSDPCDVTFIFHVSGGRVLKQATRTLLPGTGASLDFRAAEAGLGFRQGEIVPCVRVAGGSVVATLEMIDTLSGLTMTLAPAGMLLTP